MTDPALRGLADAQARYRAAQAHRMPEDSLLASVRALAKACGWLCYHTHRSDRSEPGWPDVVLARGRTVLFRELKASTGRLTVPQQGWLDALAAGGLDVDVWRPEHLLDGSIEAFLRRPRPAPSASPEPVLVQRKVAQLFPHLAGNLAQKTR